MNPEYVPFKGWFFRRLMERERCGLPDENSISKEAALSITIQYAQQDKTLSSLKPWEKVQTYYLDSVYLRSSQNSQPNSDASDVNSRKERGRVFRIARSDPPPAF